MGGGVAGGGGGAGGGMPGGQENSRLSQIVLHELKSKWNPQGWQQEMTPNERANTILQMYRLFFLFLFLFFSLPSALLRL